MKTLLEQLAAVKDSAITAIIANERAIYAREDFSMSASFDQKTLAWFEQYELLCKDVKATERKARQKLIEFATFVGIELKKGDTSNPYYFRNTYRDISIVADDIKSKIERVQVEFTMWH